MPVPAKAAKFIMTTTGKMLRGAKPALESAARKLKNAPKIAKDMMKETKSLPERLISKHPDRTVKRYNEALQKGQLMGDIEPTTGTLPHIKEVLIKKFGKELGLKKFESIRDFDNAKVEKTSPEFFHKLKRIMGNLPD